MADLRDIVLTHHTKVLAGELYCELEKAIGNCDLWRFSEGANLNVFSNWVDDFVRQEVPAAREDNRWEPNPFRLDKQSCAYIPAYGGHMLAIVSYGNKREWDRILATTYSIFTTPELLTLRQAHVTAKTSHVKVSYMLEMTIEGNKLAAMLMDTAEGQWSQFKKENRWER